MKNRLNYTFHLIFFISKVSIVMSQESGELDSTFNFDGISSFSNGGDKFYDIAIQTDGKILTISKNDLYSDSILVARFNNDGGIDSTFGFDGTIQTPGSGLTFYGDGYKIIAVSDGSNSHPMAPEIPALIWMVYFMNR